ncbi:hypothetical protein HYE82_12845 [Streptomyces sp. BR123]|uniref:hypothetical protein n=1 Tax=Streptomyces sp. BR123 TaxID=2749828 RepID=UPI0015C4D5D8|nr:hypothetical protein [Streptomyces sp. BR123]NXY95256.1 hypothetical protein [Streptomyces sp. BR123]
MIGIIAAATAVISVVKVAACAPSRVSGAGVVLDEIAESTLKVAMEAGRRAEVRQPIG